MVAMIDGRDRIFAHPSAWAPFVVVGEGGGTVASVAAAAPAASQASSDPASQPPVFVTVRNSNVRAGPSTDTERLITLPVGTRVEVLDTAAGGEWYRIAQDGRALGYVYAPLLEPVD
jgi:uncharacterized protein YraI